MTSNNLTSPTGADDDEADVQLGRELALDLSDTVAADRQVTTIGHHGIPESLAGRIQESGASGLDLDGDNLSVAAVLAGTLAQPNNIDGSVSRHRRARLDVETAELSLEEIADDRVH